MDISKMTRAEIEFDPMCDKYNPQILTFEDVSSAAYRIQKGVLKTPCTNSHLSVLTGMEIYLKCEFLHFSGSFKERGARNALMRLAPDVKKRGVIAASLGNHSQGMSYHGRELDVPVTVVMPRVAPIMKIQKCRSYGAEVIIHGDTIADSKFLAMSLSKERNIPYINGYDHPHIMAGQGTVALEILEQVPDVDAILVPVGGGGLIAGMITVIRKLKPHVLVYGVETENVASMKYALEKGGPAPITITSTLADGLAVSCVGVNAFATVKHGRVDRMITVNEDWLARAILQIVELEKFVVEGAGSVTVAAIMSGMVPELTGKKVVSVLSGGNIDTTILGRCLERGMAAEHRLVKFKVTVSDRPGGVADLTKLIASIGVTVKDMSAERAWVRGDVFSVRIKLMCETYGGDHLDQLRALIKENYKECYFFKENEISKQKTEMKNSTVYKKCYDPKTQMCIRNTCCHSKENPCQHSADESLNDEYEDK